MNYALVGILLFLTFSHLTFGLKGEDRKVKIKTALAYFWFFLLCASLMLTYHFARSSVLENPIIQKLAE